MQHIGKNIKSIISNSKFSAKEISVKLDVSYQYLYKIFNSENVDTKYLFQLAEILNVPVTAFFGDDTTSADKTKVEQLENNYNDLKAQFDKLHEKSELYKILSESISREASAYLTIISALYEDFYYISLDYSVYVIEYLKNKFPEIKRDKNGELLNKYLNEHRQLQQLIRLKEMIEPVVDKRVLERIELHKNVFNESYPFAKMFTQSSQKD